MNLTASYEIKFYMSAIMVNLCFQVFYIPNTGVPERWLFPDVFAFDVI
jgi:hypothetical protein